MRIPLAPKARAPRTSKASAPSASAKRERRRSSVLAIAIVMGVACTASAQDPFPEGPGKDVTVRMCGTCHPSARGASVRLTREGWQNVIAKMVSLGAKGTDEELAAVLDYMVTHFEGDAPKPVNMNTAPAIDLESVAGLLRKEAAALIAYRSKHGPCKTLDDLKKVPGVDFRKINRRRDRLVCF
jgi:competence ComEA-like helix-hairpin-helix protein